MDRCIAGIVNNLVDHNMVFQSQGSGGSDVWWHWLKDRLLFIIQYPEIPKNIKKCSWKSWSNGWVAHMEADIPNKWNYVKIQCITDTLYVHSFKI